MELPTYLLGEEDPNPPFQMSDRHDVYPYTMLDDLTDRRESKTYRAIYLENEFLKVIILPELGGRVYSVFDKVARREVFYRNQVVKYGLVALRGAWISGGIEFNFPNGHTMVTVSPVDSQLTHEKDGSSTAIVGGTDLVTEMHWEVALTLRPGRARLEQHVTLFNDTPLPQLYWYWANAGVPATKDMQFIYPMREANPHSETEIWSYPVWNGVDYSWYKNIRHPTSLFGTKVQRSFFGAYYHDSDYGVVHVADFHEVPGKKIWSWGTADDGLIWTDLLTDADGPYNEIQSGRYETQLSQEFLSPRRVESWTEYWYPVRGLGGGFVEATNELALNVNFGEVKPSRVELALYPVVNLQGAKLRVRVGGRLVREVALGNLKAGNAAKLSVPVASVESAKKELVVEVNAENGDTLLRWSAVDPLDGNPDFTPAAGVHAPKEAGPNQPVDELFLHGVHEEKEGRTETAAGIYKKVLERDAGHVGALLKLAWRDYRAADFVAAEKRIARALESDSADPGIYYAAGVIHRGSGRWTRAEEAFWSAIQFGGPPAPSLTQLGEIATHQKRYEEAARLLRQALRYNPDDALALTELAVALRLAGRTEEAQQSVGRALVLAPLLPFAVAEQERLRNTSGARRPLTLRTGTALIPHTSVETYLSVAAWYRDLGDLDSSNAVLEYAAHAFSDSPLVNGYLASNAWKSGHDEQAKEFAAKAAAAPYSKVFPHRLSDVEVLGELLAHNPKDAHAHFLLGNFLFARGRHQNAAESWERARAAGFDDSVLERNLGFWAWHVRADRQAAAASYAKAIQLAPKQYRLYNDLDQIYSELGDKTQRESLYASAPKEVLDRDTVRLRRAVLLIEQHNSDAALALLKDHRFKPWEGGQSAHEVYVLGAIERGRQALAGKNYELAERSFRAALEYPVNLGVGKPDGAQDPEANYWLGEALSAQGNKDAAMLAWQSAANEAGAETGVPKSFRAAALLRLGKQQEADRIFVELENAAKAESATASELCAAGLAERLKEHDSAAASYFQQALQRDPGHLRARVELEHTAITKR